MNVKTLRMGAVTVMSALAFGTVGTTAQAAVRPAPAVSGAPVPGAPAPMASEQAARQLAANLLAFEGGRFSAPERAELQAIADGIAPHAYGKLDPILKLLKKVKGFASAVAKSYREFQAWYNGLPWYVKGPLKAAGVGGDLLTIWQLFH